MRKSRKKKIFPDYEELYSQLKDLDLKYPDDSTEKEKKSLIEELIHIIKYKYSTCCVYKMTCKCEAYIYIKLNSFPMYQFIQCDCPVCKKMNLGCRSDPLIFYSPYLKEEISINDLKNYEIPDSCNEKNILLAYQDIHGEK